MWNVYSCYRQSHRTARPFLCPLLSLKRRDRFCGRICANAHQVKITAHLKPVRVSRPILICTSGLLEKLLPCCFPLYSRESWIRVAKLANKSSISMKRGCLEASALKHIQHIVKEKKTDPGFKVSKDQLTLFSQNTEGNLKLKPLLVYQSVNPQPLKASL